MSADVVGYSRLMGVDEAGTLAALRSHRTELIDAKIDQHGGRIVKGNNLGRLDINDLEMEGLSMHAMEVFDPSGAMEVINLHAPRLDSLAGKTVALLSDDMWQAHRMLPLIREKLQAQYPDATFIPETEFPMGTREIDTEETVDMLVARGAEAVIVGNAS